MVTYKDCRIETADINFYRGKKGSPLNGIGKKTEVLMILGGLKGTGRHDAFTSQQAGTQARCQNSRLSISQKSTIFTKKRSTAEKKTANGS